MSNGTLIRVIPKTLFDFGYLAAGATDEIIVAKALNIIPYSSAHLWVRVYQRHIGSSALVKVVATGALPAEDTQQSFLESTSTELEITGTPPVLSSVSLTAVGGVLAPYMQIAVQGVQASSATNIGVEISIDVLVRCCG